MSRTEQYLNILSEIFLNLIILRKNLIRRTTDVFLSNDDYQIINTIKNFISDLEELDSI